jgi:dsRNA-specific ribonuclease
MKQTPAAAAVPHGQVPPPLRYSGNEPGHARAVDDLRAAFELTRAADPWLSQALTHRSWTYENPRASASSRQRSNTLLAHHGSHVARALMAYDRALEAAGRGLRPTAEEARISSVANTECRRLGAVLRLVPGMLIGAGERKNRVSDPSDGAAQAVLAVAWRHRGTRLLVRRPRLLHEWLVGMDYGFDPSTQLERLCSRFGITLESDFFVRGPDHGQERLCELTLTGSQGAVRWSGQAVRGGKTQAKHQAAHEVLELVHAHAEGARPEWSPDERELLGFALRQQLMQAPSLSGKQQQRCVQGGELGLDLLATGDDAAFRDWAARTTDLTGALPTEAADGLLRFYTECLGLVRYGADSPLRTALREASVGCAPPVVAHAARSALRAAASATGPGATLRGVLGTWWTETAETHQVRMQDDAGPQGGVLLDGGEAAALRAVLDRAAQAARSVDRAIAVDLSLNGGRPYLLAGIDGVDLPATCDALLALVTEVVPSMRCTAADGGLLVHWRPAGARGQDVEKAGNPLAVAGLSALTKPLEVPRDLMPAHPETGSAVRPKESR